MARSAARWPVRWSPICWLRLLVGARLDGDVDRPRVSAEGGGGCLAGARTDAQGGVTGFPCSELADGVGGCEHAENRGIG